MNDDEVGGEIARRAMEASAAILPEGVSPDDEIEVSWQCEDGNTRVEASLGEAAIIVDCSEQGAAVVPWLVAALPNILEAAWAQIEDQTNQEES